MRYGLDIKNVMHACRAGLNGPHMLAFLPALCLAAYWGGGEVLLVTFALVTPLIYALTGGFGATQGTLPSHVVKERRPEDVAKEFLDIAHYHGQTTACFKIELRDLADWADRFGSSAADEAREVIKSRLISTLRQDDYLFQTSDRQLTILLAPGFRLKLDALLDLARRLRTAAEMPISVEGRSLVSSIHIGIASSLNFGRNVTVDTWFRSASEALSDALETGTGTTRVWSDKLSRKHHAKQSLHDEVIPAFEAGQIQAFFQPQVNITANKVMGMETLARWDHPTKGIIPAEAFLNAVKSSQQMSRLGRTMLTQALAALNSWDYNGYHVPTVSVNLSEFELRDPELAQLVKVELDRSTLPAHRLIFEVPETVLARSTDDIIRRNIRALASLGCSIDLDGYGVGGSDIALLQNIPLRRVKIDKSLVRGVDASPDMRCVLNAILSVCDTLQVESVGTGVETIGEHGALREIGYSIVQGFLFAEPCSAVDMGTWLADQQSDRGSGGVANLRQVK